MRVKNSYAEFARWVNWLGSQAHAAGLIGVSESFVSLLVARKRGLSLDLARRIEIAALRLGWEIPMTGWRR